MPPFITIHIKKSLLRILKFKSKKNTILQLSTKPVTTSASWMSCEPKDEAQRKHLSQAKPCQPHITDKSQSFSHLGMSHQIMRDMLGA